MRRTIIELSHAIHDGMDVYPGLSSPRISLHRDRAGSRSHYQGRAEFAIGRVERVGNTAPR
jgi:arylformamidase